MPNGAPQFRPQQPQNPVASSPFANPPPGAPTNNPNIRPGSSPASLRPPTPTQQSPSGAPMNMNRPPMRPPMNGVRPPLPSAPTTPSGDSPTIRPPFPQSPSNQGAKPPTPQMAPGQFANPPTPQNSSLQINRPPMSQTAQAPINSQVSEASPFMRPPIPNLNNSQAVATLANPTAPQTAQNLYPINPQSMPIGTRPPIPNLNTAQSTSPQGIRPPMMQNSQSNAPLRPAIQGPHVNAPLRPPMPQSPQASGPFARPPSSAPHNQVSRPPPMPMHPPVPTSATQSPSVPMRPPMPIVPSSRPPMPTAPSARPQMPTSQTQMAPPMQARPPMSIPGNSGLNQPINQMPSHQAAPGPQIPAMKPPSMRYPASPGYVQQQPPLHPTMQQQPAYPQTMPSTQQQYPTYPQAPNAQNAPQYPSHSYSGGSLAPQQTPAPKVNPAAIPSVVAVLEADELRFKEMGQPFYTFSSIVDNPPPLPTTRSVSIIDDGNSSPQFIRSTLNHIPISEEICENTKIPLGLIIQPFATSPQNEVPLVDFGTFGPLRCNRCRAYVNPHVQFIKGGRYYVCNLCDMSNEVPDEYYANLDMSGKRIDFDLRPELKYGTVDFVATKVKTSKNFRAF